MKRILSLLCCALLALCACAAAEQTPLPTLSSGALDVLAVDHRLYELGYRDSACTGQMNDVLINALKNFQRANGLALTGEPDEETVILLMSGEALSQKDYIASLAFAQSQEDVMQDGDYGNDVLRLQKTLKKLGYFSEPCDGAYGRATQEAVYRFQLANGLQETGVADRGVTLRLYSENPVSWDAFLAESCASAGASGAHVRRIQLWLKHKNYFFGACTGRYGDGTQQAVKRFQAANGLEASGDVDMETCIALFSDINAMHEDVKAIRRGETGAEVAQLAQALAALGYPAREQYSMQTELAVMQFQQVNEIPVTGVADGVTLSWLSHQNVQGRGAFAVAQANVNVDDEELLQLTRQALSQLGQQASFDSAFDFVSYVYLKCGLPLLEQDQLTLEMIESRSDVHVGQVLFIQTGAGEICGIATTDGAVVCQDASGYIVMRYLDMMDVVSIRGSFNAQEGAA